MPTEAVLNQLSSRKVTDRGWEETVGRGTCTA